MKPFSRAFPKIYCRLSSYNLTMKTYSDVWWKLQPYQFSLGCEWIAVGIPGYMGLTRSMKIGRGTKVDIYLATAHWFSHWICAVGYSPQLVHICMHIVVKSQIFKYIFSARENRFSSNAIWLLNMIRKCANVLSIPKDKYVSDQFVRSVSQEKAFEEDKITSF